MPMLLYCEISPATVRYNKSLVFQKNWFITDINQKQVKNVEQEEKVLVKEVTGKPEAFPGQKAEYRVTRYSRDKVSDADRNSVKWAIKADGNQEELKNKKGEKITVEIKKEWAGKEIIVMAYLQSPNEKVSVKTAVIKLPLLIGQSDRKPGKEADGIKEARDMHCGDMKKEDIFRIFSDNIIEKYDDDLFTNVDYHFKLFKRMATMLFSQNNIKLNVTVFPEDLNEDCYMSGKSPVNVANLESNIISMIDHFRNGGGRNYSNGSLNAAVMAHEDTVRFFNEIRKELLLKLKGNRGDLIEKDKLSVMKRPAYNTWTDRFQGLTIALNDTWAYEVWITDYLLNDDNTCSGKMKIIIYDHFGLDDGDIGFTKPARYIDGFYHWFVLQRWEGFKKQYKPFVTVIEKKLPFKGRL